MLVFKAPNLAPPIAETLTVAFLFLTLLISLPIARTLFCPATLAVTLARLFLTRFISELRRFSLA